MVETETYPDRLDAAKSRLRANFDCRLKELDQLSELESADDMPGVRSAKALQNWAMVDAERMLSEADRVIIKQAKAAATALESLRTSRGVRYRSCRFENYEIRHGAQREAVDLLLSYAADPATIETGAGVVLFGPVGTGKDHLLMALAHEVAHRQGIGTVWRNGVDIHADLKRADFDGSRPKDDLAGCPILWVSDPLPPTGPLSGYQQLNFLGLIDARYSAIRPTWVSLNVADRAEAESRMGAQAVDRICHGALVLPCNWPSYRR